MRGRLQPEIQNRQIGAYWKNAKPRKVSIKLKSIIVKECSLQLSLCEQRRVTVLKYICSSLVIDDEEKLLVTGKAFARSYHKLSFYPILVNNDFAICKLQWCAIYNKNGKLKHSFPINLQKNVSTLPLQHSIFLKKTTTIYV